MVNKYTFVVVTYIVMCLNWTCVVEANSYVGSGDGLLKTVYRNYTVMKSYEDNGEVITSHYTNGKKTHEEKIIFRTYFSKPNKLRIQWNKHIPLLSPRVTVLLSNSCGTYSMRTGNDIREYRDVGSALSAKAGVSGTVTSTVPEMIMYGDEVCRQGMDISARILKDEQIDDHDAYVVSVTYNGQFEETLWIDKGNHVIRKIEKSRIIGSTHVKKVILYKDVKINHKINDALFIPESLDCQN